MKPILTISTTASALSKRLDLTLDNWGNYHQARPGDDLSCLVMDSPRPVGETARWGIRGEWHTPLHGIMHRRPYNRLIRRQRCVVPVNCFIGALEAQPYLIKLMHERVFGVGAIYDHIGDHMALSLITVEPPPILQPYVTQMPVLLPIEKYIDWLDADDVAHVVLLAEESRKHWFDLFPVDPEILKGGDERDYLKPIGPSVKDLMDENNEVLKKALALQRMNRGK